MEEETACNIVHSLCVTRTWRMLWDWVKQPGHHHPSFFGTKIWFLRERSFNIHGDLFFIWAWLLVGHTLVHLFRALVIDAEVSAVFNMFKPNQSIWADHEGVIKELFRASTFWGDEVQLLRLHLNFGFCRFYFFDWTEGWQLCLKVLSWS